MTAHTTVAMLLAVICARAATAETVAFTLSSIPLRSDGATVYRLDEGARMTAAFGSGLPASPELALAEVRRRLKTRKGREQRARIEAAAAGRALAARLGVEKLPAMVVDGRYVVYGVRDLYRARRLVRAWRGEHEEPSRSGAENEPVGSEKSLRSSAEHLRSSRPAPPQTQSDIRRGGE